MSLPTSVQLYSVRNLLGEDRDGTLRRIAEIGYPSVEPYNPTDDPQGFRKVVDDLGVTVSSTHAGALLKEEAGPIFDAVNTLGTNLAIVPGGIPAEEFTTRDGLQRTADTLNGLADKGRAHGIEIGYHNHWWEIEPRVEDRHAIEVLADLLDPAVFLQIDTYWAAVGGADAPALLGRLGDRVRSLHVKDGPVVKGQPHTALGAGVMPVPAILAAAPDAQRIVELDDCATDIVDALAESITYLKSLESA